MHIFFVFNFLENGSCYAAHAGLNSRFYTMPGYNMDLYQQIQLFSEEIPGCISGGSVGTQLHFYYA
jgi:hypothetical protein